MTTARAAMCGAGAGRLPVISSPIRCENNATSRETGTARTRNARAYARISPPSRPVSTARVRSGTTTMRKACAQAFRMVVVPDLTRAVETGRLGGEMRAYALAFLVLAVPVSLLVALFSHRIGELITGSLPAPAPHIASRAVVILVAAAFGQLLAALAASALAALDSYGTAAAGFALGGVTGLVVFALLANSVGIVALAWGLAVNSVIAICVPLFVLLRRGALGGPWPDRLELGARLGRLAQGAAVPLALQGC